LIYNHDYEFINKLQKEYIKHISKKNKIVKRKQFRKLMKTNIKNIPVEIIDGCVKMLDFKN